MRLSDRPRRDGARTARPIRRPPGTTSPSSCRGTVLHNAKWSMWTRLDADRNASRNTRTPHMVVTGSGEQPARWVVMSAGTGMAMLPDPGEDIRNGAAGRGGVMVAMLRVRGLRPGTRTSGRGRTGGREIGDSGDCMCCMDEQDVLVKVVNNTMYRLQSLTRCPGRDPRMGLGSRREKRSSSAMAH